MEKFFLPYGKEKIPISLPQKNLLKICLLKDKPGVEDNIKEIKEAIKNPIGSKTISQIAQGKHTAVVICTDITRPTPDKLLIPPILDELNKGEISDKNIKVIIARGQHRKMTEEEVKEKVGEDVLKRVKIGQHDPDNNLFYLAKSKRGNELWVNKDVVQADVKIATGNIIPHRYAGYGGGAKSILPGISSRETIGHNHLYVETGEAALGKIEGNPVREEMEEAARMIGLDMIVNTVMNVKNEIIKVVTGDPAMAHQAGVRICNDIYGVKIPEKADIILASSYPMDISFHQASKTLEAIGHIIKEKSTIIMLSPCYEGIGGKDFVDYLNKEFVFDGTVVLHNVWSSYCLSFIAIEKIEISSKSVGFFRKKTVPVEIKSYHNMIRYSTDWSIRLSSFDKKFDDFAVDFARRLNGAYGGKRSIELILQGRSTLEKK